MNNQFYFVYLLPRRIPHSNLFVLIVFCEYCIVFYFKDCRPKESRGNTIHASLYVCNFYFVKPVQSEVETKLRGFNGRRVRLIGFVVHLDSIMVHSIGVVEKVSCDVLLT